MMNYTGAVPVIPENEAVLRFALWTDEDRVYFRVLAQHPLTYVRGMAFVCPETGLKVRSAERPSLTDGAIYVRGTDEHSHRCTSYYSYTNSEGTKGAILETLYRFAQEFREQKDPIGVIVGNDDVYEV